MATERNVRQNQIIGWIIKASNLKSMIAIRDGLVATMPIMLVSSVVLLIQTVPLFSNIHIFHSLKIVVQSTINIIALITAFSVAYYYGKSAGNDPLIFGIAGVCSFLICITDVTNYNFIEELYGSRGIFISIFASLMVSYVLRFAYSLEFNLSLDELPGVVAKSFNAVIPTFFGLLAVYLINYVFYLVGLPLYSILNIVLAEIFNSTESILIIALMYTLLSSLFWYIGCNGAQILSGFTTPIFFVLTQENLLAKMNGLPIPNVISRQFFSTYTTLGGTGNTIALVLIMLLFARKKSNRNIAKKSLLLSVFNINEPLTYGIPIVQNPILILPFVIAPVVSGCIAYFATSFMYVEKISMLVPWTTPALLNGFFSSGDWRVIILQIICISISMMIYYPFFAKWEQYCQVSKKL